MEKNDVTSLTDIATNNVPINITINRAGTITGLVAAAMLEAVGASPENIESWGGSVIRAGSKEQANLLTNGRVDNFSNGVFVGHSAICKIENSLDMRLIDVPEDVQTLALGEAVPLAASLETPFPCFSRSGLFTQISTPCQMRFWLESCL